MPERFRVVCIPYKALYKCSDFVISLQVGERSLTFHSFRAVVDTNLVGVCSARGLEFPLQTLYAKLLLFQRLLELQSTVADGEEVLVGRLESIFQSIVLTLQLAQLLLMSDAPHVAFKNTISSPRTTPSKCMSPRKSVLGYFMTLTFDLLP